MAKILVVDDDSTFCLMLKTFLTRNGHEVKETFSYDEAVKAIKSTQFDVVLSDFRLPEKSGMDLLHEVQTVNPNAVVILMTGYADIRMAVKAIKMGAFEYVTKPINPDEILLTIGNALTAKESGGVETRVMDSPDSDPAPISFIKGISSHSQKVNEYISLVAPTNLSVIIQGDSGTGKEFIARQIHNESKRSKKPFVAIDCGALPKDLAPSEFFGHLKGSFTGAIADKIGQFEAANGGTLFLDEIGNLSYEVQINLLRAIQERKIKRIGSSREVDVDVRLITATNEDLQEAVKRGEFREDLFHRLNEFAIFVAPLRDRKSDLTLFANHFLHLANQELGKAISGFSKGVIQAFVDYAWPGNIRELRNVIRRAVLLERTGALTVESLPAEIVNWTERPEIVLPEPKAGDNLRDLKEKAEQELILATLEKVRFNKSKAAKILNIDRKTLYNKMKQYGIPY